jgi:integrative and conjugative element protein (TIGR02256 family)
MRPAMIWTNPLRMNGKVLIEGGVLDLIFGFQQQRSSTPEAGGILLGYRRGNHIHVAKATTPQPGDLRMRNRFDRSNQFHQETAMKLWKESGGIVDYIGEWHTHPEVSPLPSTIDLSEWNKIHRARHLPMIFIVIGKCDNLWVGAGNENRLFELNFEPD